MKDNIPLIAFNRGLISRLALARTDIKRTAFSAEVETNWMPRVLGSMMLRPGWEYIGETDGNNKAVHLPFVYASDDTAQIELTDEKMRVRVNETIISRVSVSTAVTNGDFGAAGSWTDNDETGATSTIAGGVLSLVGTAFSSAIRSQSVSVAGGDQAKEHALRIEVTRGPVTFKLGTTSGGDELISATLGTGTHSLAFTPNAATIYIELSASRKYAAKVDSCEIEAVGAMEIATPWDEADLFKIRQDQSADVIYCGAPDYKQKKIERRATNSWSLVDYEPEDGPFTNINLSNVTLTPSDLDGDITLTASKDMFKSSHVGALFKVESVGQKVEETLTGEDQSTNYIRVTGTSQQERRFYLELSGTFVATVTLQRSLGEPGNWVDLDTYTGTFAYGKYDDGLANQIAYYRLTIKSGDYTSGSATALLEFSSGSITGVCRVTAFTDKQNVSAAVLTDMGSTTASSNWYEGQWSSRKGYPRSPSLHEGRLFWGGKSRIVGSVSDAYESFDNSIEGDSAPINRTIGRGPVDDVLWMIPLQRLCFGTTGAEWSARSSSFDELLTADNFNLKDPSTEGSADVNAIKKNKRGFFVQASGTALYQLIQGGDNSFDYEPVNMMELVPELGEPSITRIAVQNQPDTRIHCVRSDGKVAVLVDQPAEEVLCWVLLETDGEVEDVHVLPGSKEDSVYYTVKRTVNGATKRYVEKWALESECRGGTLNKQADSFITYEGVATTTITGLSHLEGEEVIVWADGKDLSPGSGVDQTTYTVSSGQITLSESVSSAVVGLPYKSRYMSTKLAYAANLSTALGQEKRISGLGLIFADVHHKGIRYGQSFDDLDNLPEIINNKTVATDTVFTELDTGMFEFMGDWDNDTRLCLEAHAPRPCTVMAGILEMRTNDG